MQDLVGVKGILISPIDAVGVNAAHDAATATIPIVSIFCSSTSPNQVVRKEMSGHKRFTVATTVQVHFCDPRSPWQRGSNENTNGPLQQYFPRETDLSRFSQTYLNAIALRLNQRPRKTLGFKTSPIDCDWCCTDRLNSPPESRHLLAPQQVT
jgi:hypothetical protein